MTLFIYCTYTVLYRIFVGLAQKSQLVVSLNTPNINIEIYSNTYTILMIPCC